MSDFEEIELPAPPVAAAAGEKFDQAGIDALFGFEKNHNAGPKMGLKAVIESDIISHERLPMLEVICDRMVRSFATSLRNLTSDSIEVTLEEITSMRFGEFMNRVSLPAMIGVFHVEQWDNYGLVTVDSDLIYSVVDALLGGRKGSARLPVEGRAFTSIETSLVARVVKLALDDLATAFEPISPLNISLDRIETSPRFAAIAGPSNVGAVASFRVDMDQRSGSFNILLPYATIEPVRDKLLQRFMGEKSGRLNIWESHMATEIRHTEVVIDAVLGERMMAVSDIMNLAIGQSIRFGQSPDEPLELRCSGVPLGTALIGQRSGNVAVALTSDISKGVRP